MDGLNARAYAPDVLTDINWLQSINISKSYKHHRAGQLNSAHNPQTSLVTMLGLDPQEQVLRPIQYLDGCVCSGNKPTNRLQILVSDVDFHRGQK